MDGRKAGLRGHGAVIFGLAAANDFRRGGKADGRYAMLKFHP